MVNFIILYQITRLFFYHNAFHKKKMKIKIFFVEQINLFFLLLSLRLFFNLDDFHQILQTFFKFYFENISIDILRCDSSIVKNSMNRSENKIYKSNYSHKNKHPMNSRGTILLLFTSVEMSYPRKHKLRFIRLWNTYSNIEPMREKFFFIF